MKRRSLDVAIAVLLAACASGPVSKTYVAPSNETIRSETEQGRGGDRPSHTIFVVNRSTVPIVVWGVQLIGCENIKQQCEGRQTNIKIGPGSRNIVQRVEQNNLQRTWTYRFTFSWRPDSSARTAAIKALADAGDEDAQLRLAAIRRSDSLRRLGPGYRMLSRDEHVALKDRVALIRADPESLVLAPGERITTEGIRILMVDAQGNLLGRTPWLSYRMSAQRAAQFLPSPSGIAIIGVRPGKAVLTYALADQAAALMTKPINEIEIPVYVRYAFDPHAPEFAGTLTDADTKVPLRCATVVLEDSVKNVVNQTRSDGAGMFTLRTPRAGTYHVRVDLIGWTPFSAPNEVAAPDEKKQSVYQVQFGEQIMSFRPVMMEDPDEQHARLTGAASPSTASGAPPGQNMRLSGSASLPILEIISARIPAASGWAQFAVDDAGKLDTASVVLPAGIAANARAAVMRALPQLRFTPAKESGRPVCELMRLTVNFTPR